MHQFKLNSNVLAALLASSIALSNAAQAQIESSLGPQLNIAHRGASAYAPEHTFYAYDLAMEMDVDMLECDLFLTKDEVPICIHDSTVDRTSDGSGQVQDFTLDELRALDFGSWFGLEYAGARIVPFEEQLDCYLDHNPLMRFHVETKDSADGRAEAVLIEVLARKGLLDTGDIQTSTIVMQSFDAASLERIRELSELPTAFLFAAATSPELLQWMASGSGPDYIDAFAPNAAAILSDPTSVQRFHANGHDVHTWTVNERMQMDYLLDLGVDGIFTNNPDILRVAIDAKGNGTSPEQRGNPSDFERGCQGIAGRVVSNNGPGDVWERRDSGRGVVRVEQAAASDLTDYSGPRGGAMDGLFMLLLAGSVLAIRRIRYSRSS